MAKVIAPAEPEPVPFHTPETLDEEAFFAFEDLIAECGKSIHRMPSSCEMLLRQHLADFPTERQLLAEALRRGVPEQILQISHKSDHDQFLAGLASDLARAAHIAHPEARWAVDVWATGLNRPPGYKAPPPTARVVIPGEPQPKGGISDATLRRIMAGIAAAGGFVGGAMGNGGALLVLLFTDMAVDNEFHGAKPGAEHAVIFVVVAMVMLMGGCFGAAGAFAGWLFGRGDERPWAGFSAACGAAFGISCVLFFCVGPGLITACAQAFCAFGATFSIAARGGWKQ